MSRRARTPPGSFTSSVVTQKTGPRYTVREEMSRALALELFLELADLDLADLDLEDLDLVRWDLDIGTIYRTEG